MRSTAGNRHAHRSAQTRARFIEAGQKLFAARSIDSVSLNAITVAAGQRNRNALQYHFGGRDGLLQAIIDMHATRVHALRQRYLEDCDRGGARHAARALIGPLADYVEENPHAVYYIKILSQMAAQNSTIINPDAATSISFRHDEKLERLLRRSLAHLKPAETRRRLFLALSMIFHGIADICRASEARDSSAALKQRELLFEQLILAVETLLAAPPLENARP